MTTSLKLTAFVAVVAVLGCSNTRDSQTGDPQVVSRIIYVDGMT